MEQGVNTMGRIYSDEIGYPSASEYISKHIKRGDKVLFDKDWKIASDPQYFEDAKINVNVAEKYGMKYYTDGDYCGYLTIPKGTIGVYIGYWEFRFFDAFTLEFSHFEDAFVEFIPNREATNFSESFKESSNMNRISNSDIARFLKDAVNDLQTSDGTCTRYILDGDLALYVGWESGFAPNDKSVIHANDEPTWGLCAKIADRNEYLWVDYEFNDMPYDATSNEVYDTDTTISPNEDYDFLASWFVKEYNNIRKELDEGTLVLEESKRRNRKARRLSENKRIRRLHENKRKRTIKESVDKDNIIWSSDAQYNYWMFEAPDDEVIEYFEEIEEEDTLEDNATFDDDGNVIEYDIDKLRDIIVDREVYDWNIDKEDLINNIIPEIKKQCYDGHIWLLGNYQRWDGGHHALGYSDDVENYIEEICYPNYDANTVLYKDGKDVVFTEYSHDTPMGGTSMKFYSFKDKNAFDAADSDNEDGADGIYYDSEDIKTVEDWIKKGYLTPVTWQW